jgi:hypothetical protein
MKYTKYKFYWNVGAFGHAYFMLAINFNKVDISKKDSNNKFEKKYY